MQFPAENPTFFQTLMSNLAPERFPRMAPPDPAARMRAVVYEQHGGPEVLQVIEDFPRPQRVGGQALVRVRAVGVNPVDFKMRQYPIPELVFPLPHIPGTDIAGEILEGDDGGRFAAGQRVYAMMPLLGSNWGGSAEVAPVDVDLLAPMPENLDFHEAAALPLVALTVLQGLSDVPARPGQRVLVQAGSGGVGTFAIQYCHHVLGLRVTTTCSPRNEELVRSLGAEEVIDYTTQDFEDVVQDYDIVVDPLGYRHEQRTLSGEVLRRFGGHYVHIAGSDWSSTDRDPLGLSIPEAAPHRVLLGFSKQLVHNLAAAAGLPVSRYHFVFVHPDGERLRSLTPHVEAGRIRPVLDRTFPLDAAADAHRYLQDGHATGKVVLQVS